MLLLFISIITTIILIVMISKYLNRLKTFFGAHQMKMLMFPRINHSFSVVGHQTFGHFLTNADPVMIQLQKLNNYFAYK